MAAAAAAAAAAAGAVDGLRTPAHHTDPAGMRTPVRTQSSDGVNALTETMRKASLRERRDRSEEVKQEPATPERRKPAQGARTPLSDKRVNTPDQHKPGRKPHLTQAQGVAQGRGAARAAGEGARPQAGAVTRKKHWSIEDFDVGPKKGEGKYGRVYVVRLKEKKHGMRLVYAMKVLKLCKVVPVLLDRELAIHRQLQHPHIVRFMTYFSDAQYAFVVMEWCGGGTVWEAMHKARKKGFDEQTSAKYGAQLAEAIAYLHSRTPPVLHRDIKPENTFLDNNGDLKLGDFGWSAMMDTTDNGQITPRKTVCGTPEYFAPELCRKQAYGKALDAWCVGVFIFEMLYGRPPFEARNGKDPRDVLVKIESQEVSFPSTPAVSESAKSLLRGLLEKDHRRRMDVRSVFDHAWVKENYYIPANRTPTLE